MTPFFKYFSLCLLLILAVGAATIAFADEPVQKERPKPYVAVLVGVCARRARALLSRCRSG